MANTNTSSTTTTTSDELTASRVVGDARTPTREFYKLTRKEALNCVNTVVFHEMFDLETGMLNESYVANNRCQSPPTGTTVYEVGTGRAYQYVSGMSLTRIHPDSMGMAQLREEAAAANYPRSTQHLPSTRPDGNTTGIDKPRSSGLYHVTPLPLFRNVLPKRPGGEATMTSSGILSPPQTSRDQECHTASTSLRGRLQTAREKVLNWNTSTSPEPLESVPDCSPSALVPPVVEKTDFNVCDCISLVTSSWINTDTTKPFLATFDHGRRESDICERLLDGWETLRHLRNGYVNYVINGITSVVHRLSVYKCRSVRQKLYSAYKCISCRPNGQQSDVSATETEDDERRLYKQTVFVDQFLNVFSRLANFNYTLSFSGQQLFNGGLSNVLVVDKVWTYNAERKVFVPHYQLMPIDRYTDAFVNEIRGLEIVSGKHITHVRFLSTPNTVLYTNRHSLSFLNESWRGGRWSARKMSSDETGEQGTEAKRRRVTAGPSAGTEDSVTATAAAAIKSNMTNVFVLRMKGWPRVEHGSGCTRVEEPSKAESPTSDDQTPSTSHAQDPAPWRVVNNPTLIVFKQAVHESDPTTLVCKILIEMHLGKETLY